MNQVIRKRTGTLKRSTMNDEKSLLNQVNSEKGEEVHDLQDQDRHWQKNVEQGLNVILKRLDQMTVKRNHILPVIAPNRKY